MWFTDNCFNYIKNNPILKSQFNLYVEFKNTNLSVENYFNRQKRIDIKQKNEAIEINWDILKNTSICSYKHEREHFKVYDKYKIMTKLFFIDNNKEKPIIMDVNFIETSLKENYNKEKVIEILSEMLIAPHKNKKDSLWHCSTDIIFYEALIGNLKQVNLDEFRLVLKKYETEEANSRKGLF